MARDGSGNFTLVAGNPVVTGTTITVTWANSTLSDIATALTGSLARDGQAAATGPLNMGSNAITGATTIGASGAVTAASLIPTSATVPANGLYLSAANTLGLATNSINRGTLDATALTLTGNIVAAGSVTAVGATLTGTILLGGVNATDFARLSQNNVFTQPSNRIANDNMSLLAYNTANAVRSGYLSLTTTGSFLWNDLNTTTSIGTNNVARLDISGAGNFDFKAGTVTSNNASASEVGYKGLPQNSQSVDYTAVLADAGKSIYQTGASKTVTIPSNASVPFAIGTFLTGTFTNATGGTIAITSDTMTLAATTTTGSRTVAQNGKWTAEKQTATTWLIWGIGVS